MAQYNAFSDSDNDFDGFDPEDIRSVCREAPDLSAISDVSDVSDVDISMSELSDTSDESDNDDDGRPADEWSANFVEPTFEEFTEQPGPQLPPGFDTATATPLQYFLLMFPLGLIRHMVTMTNSYAAWKQAQPDVGPDEKWDDTTVEEMRAFLAVNMLMGINKLPETSMYWSTNNLLGNLGIASTMTCNRFQKLVQYFHVSDRGAEPGRGQPGYDRLYKVRPVMEAVSQNFRNFYTLSREVSVDEAMVGFCGRLAFRQYMPNKPVKRGVKIWMLCDARSAYLSRFEVYLGRQQNAPEHGLGYSVVTRLTDFIQRSFRRVFFDNFFTSVALMERLLEVGLYACGTVRANRVGFPKDLKKPAGVRQRGDYLVLQKGGSNLVASAWKDKRLVHHLSTLSDPQREQRALRRVGANRIDLPQPETVSQYNQFMGGVDRHDQLRAKYDVGRKGKKAWRYIFWFMLNCSIVNAFVMYHASSTRVTKKKRFSHLDFRMELIQELLGGFNKRKRAAPERNWQQGLVEVENIGGHINAKISEKVRRCRYHQKVLNKRRETVYGCQVCNVHLCKDGCHALYHNQ